MILTKDNLLRFVRERQAVLPSTVAEVFDTTTMIASAALSEIAKEKTIAITYLKLSSSPYYYDPRQRECLVGLGERHLSKGEKDIFLKLKEHQILSDNSLTIQERLAIDKIKDFAIPLEIDHEENNLKFWVWYLRDIKETRTQIMEALKPKKPEIQQSQPVPQTQTHSINQQTNNRHIHTQPQVRNNEIHAHNPQHAVINPNNVKLEIEENPYELFIENFLKNNYLAIESKNKDKKGVLYSVCLNLSRMKIYLDCIYFYKKPNEAELIKFYTSSQKPKIVFIDKCPKKLLKLSEKVENLTIINI